MDDILARFVFPTSAATVLQLLDNYYRAEPEARE
jgi:hypothetical protein